MAWGEKLMEVTMEVRYVCDCYQCGVPIFMNSQKERSCRDSEKHSFFCWNGHEQVFGQSREKKIKELERQLANAREEERIAWAQAEQEAARRKTAEATLKKERRRTAAAMCPVPGCKRQIIQMARHLKTKHPDYVEEHVHAQ